MKLNLILVSMDSVGWIPARTCLPHGARDMATLTSTLTARWQGWDTWFQTRCLLRGWRTSRTVNALCCSHPYLSPLSTSTGWTKMLERSCWQPVEDWLPSIDIQTDGMYCLYIVASEQLGASPSGNQLWLFCDWHWQDHPDWLYSSNKVGN